MCSITFISTTCGDDFTGIDDAHFFLQKLKGDEEEAVEILTYDHRWFLTCRYGGCSCHFRNHLKENPFEFAEPQDWCPEDPDDVEATRAFYDFMKKVIDSGHRLDIVTGWNGEGPFKTREVFLAQVSRAEFRFMEGYHLLIRA